MIPESTIDPESGCFHKGEHRKCLAYEVHTACDSHNFVLAVEATAAGNVHDARARCRNRHSGHYTGR